ncbi:MAG TPA: methyl-accepting chemotaxis protein, partial [Candidatus Competibacteraceae bacterium]|nr:methyl-accepting chemotaxis protein [Candidatus Competibacteraceae bacterium]
MFKNIKLRTQLNLGFAISFVLLVVVAATAGWGLQSALDGFTEYRWLVRASNRVADFQDEILSVRFAVQNFIINGDDQSVQAYHQRFDKMEATLKDLKKDASHPERAKQVALVETQSQQYNQAFDQAVAARTQQNELLSQLRISGTEALDTLISLSGQSGIDQNTVVLEHTGALMAEFLKARIAVLNYLLSHQPEHFEQAREAMADKVNKEKEKLVESAQGAYQSQLETFTKAHETYVALLPALRETIEKGDDLVKNTLRRIGLEVAKVTEEVKASYRTEQEALGPEVQRTTTLAVNVVAGLSIAAVILGVILAWLMARLIQRPIGGEPGDMAAMTGQIASGDLAIHFTDTGKETGIYAAMRDMVRQLREMVSQVTQATSQVSSAAAEIAQGSADL